MNLEEMTLETFEPHVGSTFTISFHEAPPVELKLVRLALVMERVRSPKLKRQPFSAMFEGSDSFLLPQRMYDFSHDVLGDHMPIFIVPVGRENGVVTYEAVFT